VKTPKALLLAYIPADSEVAGTSFAEGGSSGPCPSGIQPSREAHCGRI
jgi:hypothetical protein